jgi:thiamine-monophosphate kinase
MKMSELGERSFVEALRNKLRRAPGVVTEKEEDAEILELNGLVAVTTDMHCAGTHFRSMSPTSIGRRVVVSTLTDLLAKGALPKYFMTSIGAPADTSPEFLETLYESMDSKLEEFNAFLIGGDTVKNTGLVIDAMAFGLIQGKPLLRSTAQPGDKIVVTGEIGNGALGYLLLKKGVKGGEFVKAQLEPEIDFGLCKQLMKGANAGMDVSDGLAYCLYEMSRQSSKKFVIEEDALPLNPGLKSACEERGFDFEEVVFHVGDDYQVLYTHPDPPAGFVIGEVQEGSGVEIQKSGGRFMLEGRGWDSFKS